MKFNGEIKVNAAREDVFERLNDARFFASCLEGVSNLEQVGPRRFTAVLENRVAYIKVKFQVTVEITESESPSLIVAKTEGEPVGMVGRLLATSRAELREVEGQTVVDYEIDLSLAGKLGSIGQPVLRSRAREMERQFAASLIAAFEPTVQGKNP